MNLTYLKNFTEAYANFNFETGTMDFFAEMAMDEGKYEGYVKPILKNIKVINLNDNSESFWRKAWEVVVGTTLKIFQNQKKEQFATEVPFNGNIKSTDVGILATITNVFKNAFIDAFEAKIDDKVSLQDVNEEDNDKGFFDFLKKEDNND